MSRATEGKYFQGNSFKKLGVQIHPENKRPYSDDCV